MAIVSIAPAVIRIDPMYEPTLPQNHRSVKCRVEAATLT